MIVFFFSFIFNNCMGRVTGFKMSYLFVYNQLNSLEMIGAGTSGRWIFSSMFSRAEWECSHLKEFKYE